MDVLTKAFLLAIIILARIKQESCAEDPNEIQVHALRMNNTTDTLQLKISWNSELEHGALYEVSAHLNPTEDCSIQHTPFPNAPNIKCEPLVTDTSNTSVLLPGEEPAMLTKHRCVILPMCTYQIFVKAVQNDKKALSAVYQVPECVEEVCSCYYDQRLPNISTNSFIRNDQLNVNWTLGSYIKADLPDGVELDHVLITVRSGLNEDLGSERQANNSISIAFEPERFGSYYFDINDFPGNKSHFVVHSSLYDSRQCYSESEENIDVVPEAQTSMESRTEDLSGLQVYAVKFNNTTDRLQLNVTWHSELKKGTLYQVSVHLVPTENCAIQHTPFVNNPNVKCVPIDADTEETSVIMPFDAEVIQTKHQCVILPMCVYQIFVKRLDHYIETLSTVYQVPECVEEVCSCYYERRLPNISANSFIQNDQLVVEWTLDNYTKADLPDNVDLDHVFISVRSGFHGDLERERQTSKHRAIALQPLQFGIYAFNINDFPGNKTHFVVHSSLYDSRRCYSEAEAISVYIPNSMEQNTNRMQGEHDPQVSELMLLVLAVFMFCIVTGLTCIVVYYQRKKKQRRQAQNWREVYITSGTDHHLSTMQMEENRLYIDMDILEARAKGDADQLEVSHTCLRIGREIGKGAFGRVFVASATNLPGNNGSLIVAVKQLKKCPKANEFDEFLDEIAMMKRVGRHPNIVTLLGCCTIKEPLTMIMEYIGCGDLLEYLRKIRAKHLARLARHEATVTSHSETISIQQSISNHSSNTVFGPMIKYMDLLHTSSSNSDTSSYITQPDTVLRPSLSETMYTSISANSDEKDTGGKSAAIEYVLDHMELHDFARQISCGMQHLEEKKITHRDLAARNILIDERKTLKISDFGLSRTGIYVNTRNKKVPLRWLSIEAMRDNLYSNKSDVWAFGIVLWEIGTLGGYPYPTVSNHELLAFLNEGKRLDRPDNCTSELYELMLKCWRTDPNKRPSFNDISKMLEPHRHIYIDFNDIEPTYVFPPTSDEIKRVIANNK